MIKIYCKHYTECLVTYTYLFIDSSLEKNRSVRIPLEYSILIEHIIKLSPLYGKYLWNIPVLIIRIKVSLVTTAVSLCGYKLIFWPI